MWDKYRVEPWGIGGKIQDKVEEVSGNFMQLKYQPTQESAREFAISFTQRLLDEINSNEKIRPYLAVYPFPSERLKIYIVFATDHHCNFPDGIEHTIVENNRISYYQNETQASRYGFPMTNVEFLASESYTEALKIVQGEAVSVAHLVPINTPKTRGWPGF